MRGKGKAMGVRGEIRECDGRGSMKGKRVRERGTTPWSVVFGRHETGKWNEAPPFADEWAGRFPIIVGFHVPVSS